jgi:hypothetical protein
VNFQSFCRKTAGAVSIVIVCAAAALAQTRPTLVIDRGPRNLDVVTGNNLYCAGYVQTTPLNTAPREETPRANKIVGAYNEQDGWHYAQNRYLLINGGANKNVQVGDMFSVIRPRGQVETRWTKKHDLGVYVQELGTVEVVRVKAEVAVVRVKNS